MPATTLAWNDPRVMNRVAEQYKQLRAKVDKLRVLQKQLEQGGGAEAALTAEQRAQLELLPSALEDLRELREGRMPAHPIALLSSNNKNSNTITTGASPSGTSSVAATTVLVAASGKKAKKAARGNAQDLGATKEAVHTDVADADKTTSDEASTTASNKNNKKTASGTAVEADVVLSGRADDKAATDATPDITTTGQTEEVDEEEGGDKTSKSKKKNKNNNKRKNNNKTAPANEAEAEAAAAVEEEEDDPSNRATWLRRLSRQTAPKARQALLEDYVAYYLSSSAACSPALLAAAEKKLKAAMECKKRVLQCYEQGKPPSKKQLDTIEQLPALRRQLAQCARQVKLEAEKAKAELLAAFEAQQQQEAAEEEKKKKQDQEEKAGAGTIEPELAAINNANHNTQDDHPQQPNTTAAHMTSTTPPPSASTTAALGSSTGLSLAITNTTTTTTTTARCSSGSVGAMLPASSSSSLAGAGEDGVLVNVKSAATPTVATAAPARRGEEGRGVAEEEEKEGTHTGETAASKQEEEMNEEDEKAEGEDTTKANDKAQQHANADEDEEEEDKTQDITEERTTTTNTTTATLAAAEHETLSTADALLHSVAPAANITIQSGSEWARVLRYCAPTGPTSSNTTIYASHRKKKEEEEKECNAQGDEAAMTMRTPPKPRRAVGVRAQNNGFTLRGFYSLIPRSSPLAQLAEPRRRKSLKADKKAAEEGGHEEEAVQTKSSRKQRRMSSSASSASSQKMKDTEEDGALHAPSTQAKAAKPQPVTLPCTAVPETRAALSYYRLQLCLSHRDRTAAAAAAKEEEEEQQHSYVSAKPLGREVDDHTRRLVSAITASSASHNTVRGEEGCGGELPGLRGRPMLQARLAADWAAVQAALHNNNNGGGEEQQQQQQQQAVLLPPGLSLLSCCDHTAKARTEEANYETERKEGETAAAAAGGTYTSSFVEANTPLVSWLLSYAPRCGPLAGHIVPLELAFLHSYPFVAPRLFSLVSLPHQRLVLAQGGRPNMLYLPIAAAASSSPSSSAFAANSNNDTQGVSALSLPASPCSPMTGSPTTLSPLTSYVLDMLARVPDFFEGGGFAETCRALGAEAFDTQLAQARLTLGKVWLALHHALQQQQQQQQVGDYNNNNCCCAEAVWWCNGPYLMLEQQAPQQPRKDTHSEADDTAAKSAAKYNSEAGGSIAHEESEEDTSKAQVMLYTEACKDTAAQECGVRGPWRGCWGHLLYTLPSSTHTNAASAQHTPSAMSAHTALRAEHELCVQLIQQRTTTTPSGSQADDEEEAAMPTLQLVRLPWSSLVCEAMNSNISAYKDQAHWAQQVLLLLPPPSQPMPHDEEDNASTTTTTNTTTATTQGNALQHVCWSLPRSLWSACNSAKNNHDMNEAAHAVHTAQVCIKAGRDAHCTLSQEETAAGVTTITLPTSASCAGDEPRQLDENESSTKNNKAEEEKGCVWALVLNVPAGQTVSMTITLRQAVHEEEDTTVPEDAQDTLCHAIDGGNKQADDDEEEAVKVHNNKMQADGVQQKKTSSATPRDTAEQSSTAVRGMLLAVPYGFSAARVAALPRPGPGSSTSSAACKTGKDTLSVGLCESSTGFYEDYYIPRGVSAVQGGSQALAGTHEAPPLEMNEAEFFLYRQLTPCAAADRTPTAQTNEDEEESEKGLCVACHDYLVAPPENALRRALLQLEPSPKANSNNNNTTSTTASSPSSAAERSRNVASRAVRERHLRADYFWGLRVMFLPCMSHTLRSHVLSHAAAAVSSDTSDAQTAGMAPTALTRMLRPSEHQALRRFMQSCMQLYRQPAASTAYAIPLQPLHLLHLLSLSLLHVLPQDTSETDITPCSSAAAQDILALVVALAAKEESLRELCRSIVRDQADALCPSITTKTPKMNEADGEAPAVCTLFLQMPYFPSPWAKRREASESASPPPSAAQRARTAYESALSYVAARLEDSLAGDKVVREAAAAHYVRLLQCTAFYLALQSVHQLSCVAEGEEGESTAGSAQGDKTSATKASKQRAEQILQELQNKEEEEAIEGEEAGETYTILRHIHCTMRHGAAVA